MALNMALGANRIYKRYEGMDQRTNLSKTMQARKSRVQNVQEESFCSILLRKCSQETLQRAFWSKGAPRYLVGRELIWKPNIQVI